MFVIAGGGGGVCMMSNTWRDEQHPSFINFISTFLTANAFRLNFVPIAPVISSIAFISHSQVEKKKKKKTRLVHHFSLTFNSVMVPFVLQDFIFNCGGSSVAFIFVTSLDPTCISQIFGRWPSCCHFLMPLVCVSVSVFLGLMRFV